MKLHHMNFFSLLLLLLHAKISRLADAAAANDSSATMSNSCMSVSFHNFYAFANNKVAQEKSDVCHQSQTTQSSGVLWLGESANISKDALIGNKLKIGVPIKNGFNEFMKVEKDPKDEHTVARGFPIDVFDEVMKTLPYEVPYEFFAFPGDGDDPGYYDDLISKVYYEKEYDAVVGDIAITSNRSDFVDFTYEYMEAGVSMIVPTKDDDTMGLWWFLKPLRADLWLTTLAFAVLKGILVWVFEHDENSDFQGSASELVGKILSFSLSTFFFAFNTSLRSNFSRFIENLWTFVVFILVTAYAANLTSMLTVEKLQPTVTDVNSLIKNGDYVGCQNGSFVYDLLQKLGFHESKLRRYSTVEQYADALERGSDNGGVSAIMDEIPYIKVFLKSNCRKYTMVGPTYRTGGFGFVFPRGSALIPDISRAVLNLTQGDKMEEIERKWFGDQTTCLDDALVTSMRLPLYSLRSIYIITGVAAALSLFIYFIRFIYRRMRDESVRETMHKNGVWMKFLAMGWHFNRRGTSLHNSRVAPGIETSEFNIISDNQPDYCSYCSIELTKNHIDSENGVRAITPQDLSVVIAPKKIARALSRARRNYSNRSV